MLNEHHDEGVQYKGNVVFEIAVKAALEGIDLNPGGIGVMGAPDCVGNSQQVLFCADILAE